jgi:ABC-type multidrug transport system permease subunit
MVARVKIYCNFSNNKIEKEWDFFSYMLVQQPSYFFFLLLSKINPSVFLGMLLAHYNCSIITWDNQDP